jgi:TPR repeat protein
MISGGSLRFAAMIAAFAATATAVCAAKIEMSEFGSVVIEGKIEPGDYEKFLDAIFCPETYSNICPNEVYLASPGGDLAEAMKIGRLVRQLHWDTRAPDNFRGNSDLAARFAARRGLGNAKANYMCASACFFIFVAGIYRASDSGLGGALLGIHRPYLSETDLKTLSGTQAIASASRARAVVENYLKEMGVATKYVDLMFSIPKDQVRWIDQASFEADFGGLIPDLKDWVAARCNDVKNLEQQVKCEQELRFELRSDGWQQLSAIRAKRQTAKQEQLEIEHDVACALRMRDLPAELGAALSKAVPNEPSAAAAREMAQFAAFCQDYALRDKAIRSLANRGDAGAQNILGWMYVRGGTSVAQDKSEGLRWFRRAADQGNSDAQEALGLSYILGDGVSQDYVQAYKWLTLAKSDRRDAAAAKMTAEQIAQAQHLAIQWQAAPESGHRDGESFERRWLQLSE